MQFYKKYGKFENKNRFPRKLLGERMRGLRKIEQNNVT